VGSSESFALGVLTMTCNICKIHN